MVLATQALQHEDPHSFQARRTYVVIPAYNEAGVIGDVVRDLLNHYPNVVVVDDGSQDATFILAQRAGAKVLRHAVNCGQGASLQTGISFALQQGAAFIITFDADGQHEVEDVAKLLEPLTQGRAQVTLGSRFKGSTSDMSFSRWALLKLAVFFTRFSSGLVLTDTHNGLRGFTHKAASQIQIQTHRMAHASEILDQVASMGVPYEEVPVHIRYTQYSKAKGQSAWNAIRILVDYPLDKLTR